MKVIFKRMIIHNISRGNYRVMIMYYFQKEACEMAWDLLTKCYGLSPNQLYVTYFGGEETLSLEADLETYDIWRQMG